MKVEPTFATAALAGALAGGLMPFCWSWFGGQDLALVAAFLLVVALPAHAFVVGFQPKRPAKAGTIDADLMKRFAVWLGAAAVATLVASAVLA